MAETKYRIVVIDGYIIAQFEAGKWWTAYKGQSNTEADYAVWVESESNLRRARNLVGDVQIVHTDLAPVQARGGWLAHPDDREVQAYSAEGYRMALRELARSVESPLIDPLTAFNQGKRVSVMVDGEQRRIVFMNLITQGATLTKSWDLFLEDGRQLYAPVDANNAFFVE